MVSQIYGNVGTGLPPEVLATTGAYPIPCHVPHKDWADDNEAQNYYAIERWSYRMATELFPVQGLLHLPFKSWSGDTSEAQNYYVLERWAMDTQVYGYRYALHFPAKGWAYDSSLRDRNPDHEEDNYRYLEWWALSFSQYPPITTEGVPPIYPNMVMQVYENVT
jgi:hypothetical protein